MLFYQGADLADLRCINSLNNHTVSRIKVKTDSGSIMAQALLVSSMILTNGGLCHIEQRRSITRYVISMIRSAFFLTLI